MQSNPLTWFVPITKAGWPYGPNDPEEIILDQGEDAYQEPPYDDGADLYEDYYDPSGYDDDFYDTGSDYYDDFPEDLA